MADRDDRDTSLSGGRSTSSGGSYAGQDRAPSAASSNRNSGSNGYGFGGGGATAHSVERGIDRSLSGGTASPSTSAHGSERGRDFSLGRTTSTPTSFQGSGGTSGRVGVNPDRFGGSTTPTRGTARVTNDLPTGFNPARIGDTIRASLNNPIDYDPITGMVGSAVQRGAVNPNIDPSRFGAAATPTGLDPARLGDPTAGTSLPSTGLPTGMDPTRFGGAVEPTAGVNVGRFGYEVPTSISPRTRGLGTPAGTTPAEMPNQPSEERFGPAPTGYPAAPGVAATGPVTPAGVTPASIKAMPTSRISLADAAKINIEYKKGARQVRSDIDQRVAAAAAKVLGATTQARMVISSGRRPTPRGVYDPSTGKKASGRHVTDAADYSIEVMGPGGWEALSYDDPADAKTLKEINRTAMADFGVKSIGYGKHHGQYMGPTKTHADIDPRANEWESAKEDAAMHAQARKDYTKAGTTPSFQAPVASMMASPAERTPAMAALDTLSGAGGRNTMVGQGTDPTTTSSTAAAAPASTTPASRSTPAAAGGRVTAEAPGTNNFPATPPSQAQAAGFPSFKTPATGYQRSGLLQALGYGIDAVGAVAGGPVSLALTAGAYMLTGDTPGGTVADMIGGKYGPNQYAPGRDQRYSGDKGGGNGIEVGKPTTIGSTPTVAPTPTGATPTAPTADEFVSRYIDPKYPTPFENWGEAFGWKEPV